MDEKLQSQKDKVNAMFERIEDGVKGVFDSENYRKYLSTMSKFHNYSANNCILIHAQNPQATHVAGFEAWKNLDRHVGKGEKGIQIIACAVQDVIINTPLKGSDGKHSLGEDGTPIYTKEKEQKVHFFPTYVFDVSQTHGAPLPELAPELKGSVLNFGGMIFSLNKASLYPIEYKAMQGRVKGYTDHVQKKIYIKEGMEPAQTLKTVIHEITHADIHGEKAKGTTKSAREVQAESVAFVVCAHYDLDTSQYSFPYIAAWSGGKDVKELQNSLTDIQKQAHDLIYRIDSGLAELQKQREAPVQSQTEKAAVAPVQETKQTPVGEGKGERPASMANRMAAAKSKADARNAKSEKKPPQKSQKRERAS